MEKKHEAEPAHKDEAQDKELIKAMLDKHLGKDEEHGEEVMKHAHEMYQACKEAGMEDEDAEDHVGKAMKVAKVMGKKHAEKKEGEKHEAEVEKHEAEGEKHEAEKHEAEKHEAEKKESEKEAHKESAEVIRLKGELAAFKESNRKRELGEYLDQKLAATKLPREMTKVVRESLKDPKSKEQIDGTIAVFLEGVKAGGEASRELPWTVSAERTEAVAEGESFGDCF